jgi:hypothetical protein
MPKNRSPGDCQRQLQASKHWSTRKVTAATQKIWVALWRHLRWLENQANLIPIKVGGSITLPWPSFPSAQSPQRNHHKRGGETVQTGGIREAACTWMSFAILHYTKKRHNRTLLRWLWEVNKRLVRIVVSCLVMYRTTVLLYRMMVLLASPTKVRR